MTVWFWVGTAVASSTPSLSHTTADTDGIPRKNSVPFPFIFRFFFHLVSVSQDFAV